MDSRDAHVNGRKGGADTKSGKQSGAFKRRRQSRPGPVV